MLHTQLVGNKRNRGTIILRFYYYICISQIKTSNKMERDYNEELFNELEMLLEDLSNTNTASLKTNILLQYPRCKKLLWWTYNPFKRFGVSPKTVEGYRSTNLVKPKKGSSYTIYDLLRDLHYRRLTGHAALEKCAEFVNGYYNYKDIIYKILDRGLKQGVNINTINAAYYKLIPTFSCARAKDYYDYEKKVDYKNDTWLWSRKLDGVRVEGYINGKGELHPYSREGNEFTTLGVLQEAIKKSGLKDIWLSGEFCLVDDEGNENFQLAVGEVKKKGITIKNPRWFIYDTMTPEEHDTGNGNPDTPFTVRYQRYQEVCKQINDPHIIALEQNRVESKEHLQELIEMAAGKEWEGLVLHKDVKYYGNKNPNLLKVKQFKDAEYKVLDVEIGPFTYYDDVLINGQLVKKRYSHDMVTRLVIEHRGYVVGVGSGLSIEQRKEWKKHPERIIGKTITVKYFGESKNKDGGLSLRFPVLKAIYGDERDI